MAKPSPSLEAIQGARARVERALDERGLLLEHDAALPSATMLIAGEPIRGSWWGHAAGALIYAALSELEDHVAWVKLVKGKETLIHARLFPALVAIGKSRESWQMDALSGRARELLAELDRSGRLRADALPAFGSTRAVRELFRELELKLLAHSRSIHTDGGHHVRELWSWESFQKEHALKPKSLPDPAEGKARFVQAVAGWASDGEKLLPWAVRAGRGSPAGARPRSSAKTTRTSRRER